MIQVAAILGWRIAAEEAIARSRQGLLAAHLEENALTVEGRPPPAKTVHRAVVLS